MSPRGKQTNGLLTQQKMLRAAVALFLESGYEKTTTAKIAKAAGMTQSSFFRAFASKEALLLELVRRMFGGQFALAEQHSGIEDPVLLYAVETSLQLHIAELTEPLRELYGWGIPCRPPRRISIRAWQGRLQSIFGKYMPDLELKDFYKWKLHRQASCGASWQCRVMFISPWKRKFLAFWNVRSSCMMCRRSREKGVIAAVLQMDLRRMAEEIIQKTVAQAEEGFAALPALKK